AAFADRSFWLGKIKHKGLGVFLGADTKAEIMLLPETNQEYFLPLQLSSGPIMHSECDLPCQKPY
ncbi:MAG: hypothetical protein EBY50_05110, partial [Rhodobacteraceae bacterium]|nr:hypothetical protein [Paracoccaceae bacterium]